jgi:hypothetical protein
LRFGFGIAMTLEGATDPHERSRSEERRDASAPIRLKCTLLPSGTCAANSNENEMRDLNLDWIHANRKFD